MQFVCLKNLKTADIYWKICAVSAQNMKEILNNTSVRILENSLKNIHYEEISNWPSEGWPLSNNIDGQFEKINWLNIWTFNKISATLFYSIFWYQVLKDYNGWTKYRAMLTVAWLFFIWIACSVSCCKHSIAIYVYIHAVSKRILISE